MVQYTGISTIPLLLAGVFVTFLYVTFTRTGNQSLDDEDDDEDEEYEAAGEHLLSNFDILKVWTRWMVWCECGHSFVRMMAPSFCNALLPALKKFYPGKEKDPHYVEALKRHMTFFNSEGHFGGGPNLGLSLAMEETKSKNYDAVPGEVIINIVIMAASVLGLFMMGGLAAT